MSTNKNSITRRTALGRLAGGAALVSAVASAPSLRADSVVPPLKGRINHSVCKWCYSNMSLDDLCRAARKIGIRSIELLNPNEWPVVEKHGLTCAMANGPGGIEHGFNTIANHDRLVEGFQRRIPEVANAGLENVICFSGNRRGMNDEEGLENCVAGLKQIVALAEKHKVTVCMELLNSRVDHRDYQCDRTPWGVELCRRVGSERFKLLYDIYHMQIMEGDVIRTIRDNHQYIAHYHTGGVPGRNEIDESQELFYPAIMRAIVETGFKGFVAQEFIPRRPDRIASLQQGVQICDV